MRFRNHIRRTCPRRAYINLILEQKLDKKISRAVFRKINPLPQGHGELSVDIIRNTFNNQK